MRSLVTACYKDQERALSYRLNRHPGANVSQKLDHHLYATEPGDTVRNLLMVDPDILERCLTILDVTDVELDAVRTADEDGHLVDRLMYKIGYEVRDLPAHLVEFRECLDALEATAEAQLAGPVVERELRRDGNPFFVQAESVIDRVIAFVGWALFTDHMLDGQFRFKSIPGAPHRCDVHQ